MRKAAIVTLSAGAAFLLITTTVVWLVVHDEVAKMRVLRAIARDVPRGPIASAVIAAEHPGFYDPPQSIENTGYRASLADVLSRQLCRPKRALLWHSENMLVSFVISRSFTRDELLAIYLHEVYLGTVSRQQIIGVESAAQTYFGKSADHLTVAEAAMLAGMIRSPNVLSPLRDPERSIARRNQVLRKMLELRFIMVETYRRAAAAPAIRGRSSA